MIKAKVEVDEEEFSFKQAKLRSKIRLREKRAKPIDIIMYSLSFIEKKEKFSLTDDSKKDFSIYSKEVYYILNDLKKEELEEMRIDLILYSTYDEHDDFWKSLLILCDDQIKMLSNKIDKSYVQKDILDEILNELNSKSNQEIIHLENEVKLNLENNQSVALDSEFWEIIMDEIKLSKSKALLNEYHKKIMSAYEMEKTVKKEPIISQLDNSANNSLISKNKNGYSEKEMMQRVLSYEEIGDFPFYDEVPIKSDYDWMKSIDPIKPKYSARVCFGSDYTKLKQYYDSEIPPEKYIVGYKFNIFYPDLIDVSKAPTFILDTEPENVEKCTIRFMGSPPYTDIAFKIINKVWERAYKRGFLAAFDKGMLTLHFEFKRIEYRR
jgi:hypothetical protein